jgi:two-component system C4-dicarboxylate transport response regulator DctD
VRVIAATTVPLLDRCYNGEFRTDLYYLLNAIFIAVPPMRERSEDVETLLDFFTAYYARRYHRPIPALPASSRVSCRTYSWPGNLRQLEAAARMFAVSNRGAEAGAVLATTASMSGYNIHDPALQSQVHTSKKHRTICPDSYCYS